MLHLLQRSLIYIPSREGRIEPHDAGLPPGQVHTVTVRTDDQTELRGWHILPDGQSAADRDQCDQELAAGQRLVLYFSGNAANRRYRIPEFSIFSGLGLHVFVFDYRGYGDNPGSPSEEKLTADARAVWKYTTEDRKVAPDRVVLYGESLGGCIAVRLAAETSNSGTPPGGLILRSAFSSLVDAGTHHYPWLPVRLALVDRFLSIDYIPQVTCPILHIHGARDSIIPIRLGRNLFHAAPERSSSGIAKRFVELPDAGHNDVILVAAAEVRAAIQGFLGSLKLDK